MKYIPVCLLFFITNCSPSKNAIMDQAKGDHTFQLTFQVDEVIRSKDSQTTLKTYNINNNVLSFKKKLKG